MVDDLIRRQAALDAMEKAKWAKERLMELPAAQPDHNADIGKKVCVDTISRQAALKKLAAYIHLTDKTLGEGLLTDDDCMEAAKSVFGEDELPAAQPDHTADSGKKVDVDDCISRRAAIDAIEKCYTCKHVYQRISDADTLYCRCRKGCRYEEFKPKRSTGNPQ